MRTRPFGPFAVPAIGIGTWNMERDDEAACVRAIQRAIDVGAVHVDTAELYGRGRVETLVGKAITGQRDRVFLVSKVLPHHASRTGTRKALEATLQRLGTDHLDAYLLHWPGSIPLTETIDALLECQRAGLTKCIGVSNFDERELEEAVRLAGPCVIACNQVLYHLRERAVEHAVLPACTRHDVALVAYSPFAQGQFTSNAALDEVAQAHECTARQVALAFLVRDPMVSAIPKTAHASRAEENAAAGALELTPDEVARIDAAFPKRKKPRDLPTS